MRAVDSWPFDRLDKMKILSLSRDDIMQLQAGIIFAAAELGIDVKAPARSEKIAM